jgi:hypothetical protein
MEMTETADRAILSSLCVKCCQIFENWDEEMLTLQMESNVSFPHWDSFASLETSALDCGLCYLFLNLIIGKKKTKGGQAKRFSLSNGVKADSSVVVYTRDGIIWHLLLYFPSNDGILIAHVLMARVEGRGSIYYIHNYYRIYSKWP